MTSPSPADSATTLAQRISVQFSDRPTFGQVVQDMLELTLKEKYPSLTIDLSKTQLATPNVAATAYTFQPFIPRVLEYLALGTPVDFSSRRELHCFLSDMPPHQLSPANGRLNIKDIETLVLELPWTVPIGLEDALTHYWNAEVDPYDSVGPRLRDELKALAEAKSKQELLPDLPSTLPSEVTHTLTRYWNTESGTRPHVSRWRWLSDVFKNELHIRGLQQPGLTEPAREALDQIVRWPDRDQRFNRNIPPVYAYSLQSTVTQGASSAVLSSNELLLLHFTQYGLVVLLCGPGSAVQSFASMQAFLDHWGKRITSQYLVDSVTLQRSEISGNAFDTLAAMMLEQQLADLKAVQLPSQLGLRDLNTLYNGLSDPARYLLDAPRPAPEMSTRLEPLLPEWVKKASVIDQTKFQQYSLALASSKKRSEGRTYLSDIIDIRTFTTNALLEHLNQANANSPAKAPASRYQPDDIELTFSQAVGPFESAGYIVKTHMSLAELAIKNLVSRPKGQLSLKHRRGLSLPTWLTPEFITRRNGLIEQVDIGTTYPRYLQQKLFDELPQAQERERLFAEQIPPQLLLEALKQVLNNENGMTRQGLALVEAILKPDVDGQQISGRPVVIRHLAFLREPEAQPDIVTNMFIIEPHDVETGPHLLYGPFYAGSLLEFPTRQALLQAIVTPGNLQNSVLTWMSDDARRVYVNGGFLEPHFVRYPFGIENTYPVPPTPAMLAVNGVNDELAQYLRNGKLMQYLYGCNMRTLVTQADRDSVSNSESRWAVFFEGACLLFNSLLMFPLLPGPLMVAGWLLNLVTSASNDIPALSSDDPVTRELAAVDLLLNLGMLALHLPALRAPAHTPLPETLKEQAMVPPAPRVVPEQWPTQRSPRIMNGPVALPGEHFEACDTILNLSQANAHPDQAPAIITLLRSVRVPRPASLPEPIQNGPFRGLYVIERKWCAVLGEHLYRVSPEPDGSVAIVDPIDPSRHVLALGSDAQGNWFVDLRLRLRGGMPRGRLEQKRQENERDKQRLLNDLEKYIEQQDEKQSAEKAALDEVMIFQKGSAYTEEQRALKRQKYYEVLQDQSKSYLKQLDSRKERDRLNVQLPSGALRLLMTKMVETARNAAVIIDLDRKALLAANRKFTDPLTVHQAIVDDRLEHLTYLQTLSVINDREIYWLKLNDQYLEELRTLDTAGEQVFKDLTKGDRPENLLVPQARQVSTLSLLAIKDIYSDLTDTLLVISEPLAEQVRSHSDLRTSDLTSLERLEVLNSLTEHYREAVDALYGVQTFFGDEVEQPYFSELLTLVKGLYQEVSEQLATEELTARSASGQAPSESETPAESPQKPPAKRTKKKMIKTRKNGVLIGDLKPATTEDEVDVVELRSETDDQLLATYSLQDDVWDVVSPSPTAAKPPPAPLPRSRSLKAVRRDARTLLGKLQERLRYAETYAEHCYSPQQIEEILSIELNRYRELSKELERAFDNSQSQRTPADLQLTKELSDAIHSLTIKGRKLRIDRSLDLPPTDTNLQYLLEQNMLEVAPPAERVALAGPQDYLQEYAIKIASGERKGQKLWYAHFHYRAQTTPKAEYSVAHLKTEAQRYDGSRSVVKVHRGEIGKHLAQTRFLPLAPDR